MLDFARFQNLWKRLGARGDGANTFQDLAAAYDEPQRHYHTAVHIEDCLQQFDFADRGLCLKPDNVEAALWFHDVVYDPRAFDNENRSAIWAREALGAAGARAEAIREIERLILLTKHTQAPTDACGALLIDIDLCILGRQPPVYARYCAMIREEFAWVEEALFREKRAEILSAFLKRPAIYRTDCFHSIFEKQARENIARELDSLIAAR